MKGFKSMLAGLLALVMLLGQVPVYAAAEELCEHHATHENCGYVEGESPCDYVCEVCNPVPEEMAVTEAAVQETAAETTIAVEEETTVETDAKTEDVPSEETTAEEETVETTAATEAIAEETYVAEAPEVDETTEPEYIPVESIVISAPDGNDCIVPGETLQLTATVLPENATDQTVVWSSQDESVLTVDESGLVTGIASGCTFIIADVDDGEISAQYEIAVFDDTVIAETSTAMASSLIYDADAALTYAKNNCNTSVYPGNAQCSEFVMDCLWVGGLTDVYGEKGIAASSLSDAKNGKRDTGTLYRYLKNTKGFEIEYYYNDAGAKAQISGAFISDDVYKFYGCDMKLGGVAQPGDCIFYFGDDEENPAHFVICSQNGGENGYDKYYGVSRVHINMPVTEYGPIGTLNIAVFHMDSLKDLTADITPEDYLKYYAEQCEPYSAVAYPADGGSVTTWKLPWTNANENGVQDSSLKLGTTSKDLRIINVIENHMGNIWYEYATDTNTRGFVYSGDLKFRAKTEVTLDANGGSISTGKILVDKGYLYGELPAPTRTGYTFAGWYTAKTGGTKVEIDTTVTNGAIHTLYAHWTEIKITEPYYTDVKNSTPTENNTVITAVLHNPNGITLKTGGFYLREKGSTSVIVKTDNIATGDQTKAKLDCSYNLKDEYKITSLKSGTVYEYRLYVTDASGKEYPTTTWWYEFKTAGTPSGNPVSTISAADYLKNYATVTALPVSARTKNGSSVQTWKLPWTNVVNGVQDASLKLTTVSGSIRIKNKVVNHTGNIWYEYETGTSARGFVYSGDVTLDAYYTGVDHSGETTNNAVIKGTCQNPGGITLKTGGFYLSTKAGAVANGQKKTDNIGSGYQTAAQIPCSYDLKNEYGITLISGTKYYYVLYVTDSSGNSYYSEERSFSTTGTATTSPYYNGISHGSITTNNAVIKGTCQNPSKITLKTGGFYLSTKAGAVANGQKKTDNIGSSYQTAAQIPCSYDLKNEYGITLTSGTKYYYVFYVTDSSGISYYSDEYSFTTSGKAPTVAVTSVFLDVSNAVLDMNETLQIMSIVYPDNATNKTLQWTSSNTSVATVSSSGLVTAKSEGLATITAKATDGSGISGTATVEVICSHAFGTVTLPAVAPTCTAPGLTEGKKCSACGTVTAAQVTVSAKGHTEVIDPAVAATCNVSGLTEGKHCSACNTVIVAQQTVAAKGHTEVKDAAVAATCTKNGLTEGKHCSVCNTVIVAQQTVAAKGHTDGDRDHLCDNNCGEVMGEHKDSPDDDDHLCDHCRGEEILEKCHDGDDADYNCDICGAELPSTGDVDLDGGVDADDLTLLARHVGGIELLTDPQALANADTNADGLVNSDDLTKHARFVGGIITDWTQE